MGYLGVLGRLKPGVTPNQADAELAVLNKQYIEQNPTAPDASPDVNIVTAPLRDLVVADVRGKSRILRRRRPRPADRVRQCRQPVALARAGAEEGKSRFARLSALAAQPSCASF